MPRRPLKTLHVPNKVIGNLAQTGIMSPSAAPAPNSYSIASIPAVSTCEGVPCEGQLIDEAQGRNRA